jgi:hypothetical protein
MLTERLRDHVKAIFQSSHEPIPWARMVICGIATAGPLWVGFIRGQLSVAIYAALIGYFMALNDHLGTLNHRLLVGACSYVVLIAAFFLGFYLQDSFTVFLIITLILTYWLGLMGGQGAEVERLLLFSIVEILIAVYARRVSGMGGLSAIAPSLFLYSLVAFGLIGGGMIASQWVLKHKALEYAELKPSLLSALTWSRRRHLYATSFALAVFVAIFCVRVFAVERGYWTVVTVILVMKPDRRESVYRSLQRFVGTLVGVTVGNALTTSAQSAEILIAGVLIAACLVPYAMKRNYWLVAFFVSIIVIFLLTLPNMAHVDPRLPVLRLVATLYGCFLSLLGVLIFKVLDQIFMRQRTI